MSSNLKVNSIVPATGTNVAIGTAGGTITYGASVTGVSTFSNGISVGTGASISSPATNVLTLGTNNGECVRVGSGGHVGILSTLSIGTNTQVTSSTGLNPIITVGSATTSRLVWGTPGSDYRLNLSGGGALVFGVDGDSENFAIEGHQTGIQHVKTFGIDNYGRVTIPYQPHAEGGVIGLSNASPSSNTIITFNRVDVNVGGHYDTSQYRFNCPVSGNYLVKAHAQTNGQTATTSNTVNFNIRKNGTSVSGGYESRYYGASAPAYIKLEIIDVVYANAGDYLDIHALINATSLSLEYNAADIRWRFSYTLLG